FTFVGCVNRHSSLTEDAVWQASPQDKLTMEAGSIILQLLRQGRLPGFGKDDHGNMQNAPCDCDHLFPAVRTFHLTKVGDAAPHSYTLERVSADSQWQLQRAWITNWTSHVVEELP